MKINLDKLILEAQYNEELYEGYELYMEGGTIGVSSNARKAEAISQYKALEKLSGGDNDLVIKLIELLGGIFRKAIKEYRKIGRIPNEDELIEYADNFNGKDTYELARNLRNQII